jgi:hypothetical protein
VVDILPEHTATLEDLRPELEEGARIRLEGEATESWIGELAQEHGLELNYDVLDRLPEDPGEWGSFL